MSDVNMPGMSGLELLRTVRAVSPDLPFILISGLCELSTAMDAMKTGASDYLLKPARRGGYCQADLKAHCRAAGALPGRGGEDPVRFS